MQVSAERFVNTFRRPQIIIAQRTASVEDADRIIVMEGGTINDVGTHQELLSRNKIYSEIYTSQNKAGDKDE